MQHAIFYITALLGLYYLAGGAIGLALKDVDAKSAWPAVFAGAALLGVASLFN